MQLDKLTNKANIDKIMSSAKAYDEANALKQKLLAVGFVHSLSLYGVLNDKTTGKNEYRRIEVMSNVFWTGEIIELIYRFFQHMPPLKIYTIWIYGRVRQGLKYKGGWD
jgi:hypothetical protein